jgi:diguanylate cyclase (GGDEF)-like protein
MKVLREIARRLLLSIRSYDLVGRYGGEEFLLVLNNGDPKSAGTRAEEIRRVVNGRPFQTASGPLNVTISLGLLLSKDWGDRSAEDLIFGVDAALYAAKAAGRNCVRLAKPHDSSTDAAVSADETVHRLR